MNYYAEKLKHGFTKGALMKQKLNRKNTTYDSTFHLQQQNYKKKEESMSKLLYILSCTKSASIYHKTDLPRAQVICDISVKGNDGSMRTVFS